MLKRFESAAIATMIAVTAAVVDAVYFLAITFGCGGTDTGSPPPPGSLGDALCGTPIWVAYAPLALLAIGGPFIAISRAGSRRGHRIAIGFAISAGAIAAIAIVAQLAVGHGWDSTLFVGLPVAVFLVSLLIALASATRTEDASITPGRRPRP